MRPTIRGLCGAAIITVSVCAGACGHAPPPEEEQPSADPVDDVEAAELFRRGIGLAGNGDLTRAEQYIGAAMVRGYPEDRALPVLIRVCVAASRLRVAVGYAEPYLERNPDDWSLRLVVASVYLGLDEPVKARRHLLHVLSAAPDEAEAHYLMALLMRDEVGDPGAAERHFARYLELEPEGVHHEQATHALATIRIPVPHAATSGDPSAAGDALPEAPEEARDISEVAP